MQKAWFGHLIDSKCHKDSRSLRHASQAISSTQAVGQHAGIMGMSHRTRLVDDMAAERQRVDTLVLADRYTLRLVLNLTDTMQTATQHINILQTKVTTLYKRAFADV